MCLLFLVLNDNVFCTVLARGDLIIMLSGRRVTKLVHVCFTSMTDAGWLLTRLVPLRQVPKNPPQT